MPVCRIDKKEIASALAKLQLPKNQILYLTAFTALFGGEEFFEPFLESVFHAIGPGGTVVMPAFNWDYCHGEIFDPQHTPSLTGALSEYFRKRAGTLRSQEPPWCTFTACGPRAEEIAAICGSSSFGADSVLEFLHANGAEMLLVGCSFQQGAVFVHWLEEKLRVPYRFYKKFTGTIHSNKNERQVSHQMYARDLKIQPEINQDHLAQAFEKSGFVRVSSLGMGKLRACRVRDYADFFSAALQNDPLVLLTPDSRARFEGIKNGSE